MLIYRFRIRAAVTFAVIMLAIPVVSVLAQATAPAPGGPAQLQETWDNLLHFIKVARPELAKPYIETILESGAAREVYRLSVNTTGAQVTLARGANLNDEMKALIGNLRQMIETGFQEDRKDPEAIRKAIEKLKGEPTMRAIALATERLKISGEYALPQLIYVLSDPKASSSLKLRVSTILPQLGKQAVRGLSAALQAEDARLLEITASSLGQIEYPHAAPRLKELIERKDLLERTRNVARSALVSCAGRNALDKSAAELFYQNALNYYYQRESVAPDSRYDEANVWHWRNDRLEFTPVPRDIFCDIYAMRFARLTIRHDPEFYPAVSLWVTAAFKREADLPQGAKDPLISDKDPKALFYGRASGPGPLQDVLSRALRDNNSAVAIKAINALVDTAGAQSLSEPVAGGAQPLVQALGYPDRNVRFLAAVSLAEALPEKRFSEYQLVMTVLNEAVRQTGKKTALLVVAEEELRNKLKDAIRAAGYDVIDEPDSVKAFSTARKAMNVDVVVLSRKPEPDRFIQKLRAEPLFATLPSVIVSAQTPTVRALAETDGRTVLVDRDSDAAAVAKALMEAIGLGGGKPLTPADAANWAIRAAESIRKVGMTNNVVYNASRARQALAGAVKTGTNEVRIACARALAVMPNADAQQAVADLANDGTSDATVRVAAYVALSESVRKYGNQLTDDQAQGVLDVVTSDVDQAIRDAAAQAAGGMNLPSEKAKDLILSTGGMD